MKRDPSRKLDPETMLALAKSRQRQDRRAVSYLIAAAILVFCLGGISWFLWPEEPARFDLAAYDAVAIPADSIKLYARIEADAKHRTANLEDHALRFQITATQLDERVVTDASGSAALDWLTPKGNLAAEFMVRHQDSANPKNIIRDQGRVFIWPADSRLLVVDVDHALSEGVEGRAGNTAPTLRSGAAAALRAVATKYKIVYLSAGANEPSQYKKLRAWLAQQVPPGPLLSPPTPVGSGDMDTFTIGQIEYLKKRFTQPSVGMVGRAAEAQMVLDVGWKAIVIGQAANLPGGATVVASWSDVAKDL